VWPAAALNGHLAAGDRARAAALWKKHEPYLTAKGQALFQMRVLRANALDTR
jgi:hypothetical protein